MSDDFNKITDGMLGIIERAEVTNGTMIDAVAAVLLYLIDDLDLDHDLDIQVERPDELIPERKAMIYLEDSIKRGRRTALTPPPESRRWNNHPRKVPKRPKPLATLPGGGIDVLIRDGLEITHCSPAIGFILAEAYKGGPVYTYPVTSQGVMELGDWYLRHPDGTIDSAGTTLHSSLAELEADLTKQKLAERQKFPEEPETVLDRERAEKAADTRAYLSKMAKD